MPSLSKLLFAFIREFILCCGNGVVHLIEVEGMFRKKKKQGISGFAQWIFWLENFKERCGATHVYFSLRPDTSFY